MKNLNKTCLLADAFQGENTCLKNSSQTSKANKKFNRSGMVLIDEKDDIVDGLADADQILNLYKQKSNQNKKNENEILLVKEKNNTANVADLIKSINNEQKTKKE